MDSVDGTLVSEIIKDWGKFDMDASLRPVDISRDLAECKVVNDDGLHTVKSLVIEVAPPTMDVLWSVVGLRVFNGCRQTIIERVELGNHNCYAGPFDAAAFNLEIPMEPLLSPHEVYKGEVMRFVKQDLGLCSIQNPMRITVRPYGSPCVPPIFMAVLVVKKE
jgi:hypothetical protein